VEGRQYWIHTLGCQMNERDSEIMAGQLELMGYRAAADEASADLIIINTCAVRGSAEDHAFGHVGRLKQMKDERPEMTLALAGCMAQEPGTVAWLKKHAPHVDLVFGTHNLHQLPRLLAEAEERDEMLVEVWKSAGETLAEHVPSRRKDGIRAQVNIIYGCDKFCTYCIVPFTRGRERSREVTEILREVRALAREGYEDIMFLGQNVNSYGHDLDPQMDLADLLEATEGIAGVRWIHYMTPHPRDFSDRLIDVIAASEKISHQLHLPLQAGSNPILRRMNRKYTREQYLALIEKARSRIQDVTFTTDIIVGFPGETEEDFQLTLDLVREVRFDSAFTFIYSPREGTPAARWEGRDPVPPMVKKDRLNRLMALQYEISLAENLRLIGQTTTVLVEGVSKKNDGVWAARTQAGKVVLLDRDPSVDLTDCFVPVRIESAKTFYLTATVQGSPLNQPRVRQALPLL
jgi:tRNA-2-methylthio-N6-dimethylallyladenosine synthase